MRAADSGARLLLYVKIWEGEEMHEEVLSVFASRLSYVPSCGVLTSEAYDSLLFESEMTAALDLCLSLLGRGSASRLQLVQKMCRRGIKKEIAARAVLELFESGYGNETAGALREAQRALLKLWGNRRILAHVRAKGYDGAALLAVQELLSGEDSASRCEQLIKRRYGAVPSDEHARERLIAALVRYGYTVREIKQAFARMEG